MPPIGRIKKPMPKVAVVNSSEAYRLSAGKNSRDMTTVRKPKTKKSYHSSAFPIAAAAIWRIIGADRLAGLVAKFINLPPWIVPTTRCRRCAICGAGDWGCKDTASHHRPVEAVEWRAEIAQLDRPGLIAPRL